jgi:dihydrofolate reductase
VAATGCLPDGRKTFGLFQAFWGARNGGIGEAISSKPKCVVSNTLTDPEWEGTTVISGDAEARVRELKQWPGGELLVVGSTALAGWLLEKELVDELNLIRRGAGFHGAGPPHSA